MTTAQAQKLFVADARVERWLKSHDITFTGPVTIKLADIDVRTSRGNQARQEPILASLAKSYATALKSGEQFPALVVYKRSNKWVIIDGNNRQQGANEAGMTHVTAYVIDPATPSEAIALLTTTANAKNGARVEDSWALHNAAYLASLGYTVKRISEALNISVTAINGHLKDNATKDRADSLRVTGWSTLPVRTRQILARIRLDKPFVILTEASVSAKYSANTEFGDFVGKINAAATEEEAVKLASDWARDIIEAAKQANRMGKRHRRVDNAKLNLITGIGKIQSFDMGVFHATFTTDEDRDVLKARLTGAFSKLMEMYARLEGKEETEEKIFDLLASLN